MKYSVRKLLLGLSLSSTLNLQPTTALAQGTAFTYQGRLTEVGNPATGLYDFRCAIHDAGGPMTNGQYSLTGGFWVLPTLVQTPGAPTLHITNAAPGVATIWWTPVTGTNWLLQERLSLSGGTWTNSPSGTTNPVTVPATLPTKFYRLFKP